jgi:Ca2+:H+ antiporter
MRVVQLSLLGSILSNMLLVLGTAFFVGGLRHPIQHYSKAAAITNTGMLNLAVMGLLFPAVLMGSHQASGDTSFDEENSALHLSRCVSVVLLVTYCVYLYFQLVTHTHLFEGEDTGEDEENILGFWGAITWLGILTVFIALLSEVLVASIEQAALDWGISSVFIGAIVIPIVGNAAEHAAAVIFAYRNKMDISLGVAIGSSTQIAIFVIPFCVVMAWIMGKELDLFFQMYETATLFITVVTVSFIIQSGESNWLLGYMLLVAYFIVGAGFWYHADEDLTGTKTSLGPA